MSGSRPLQRLVLSTPWARQYLRDYEARERVSNAVPEGYVLVVGAARKPGDWTIWLSPAYDRALDHPTRRPEVWRMRVIKSDLEAACMFALRHHEATITTDAAGNVTSWEDAS
jgi:hypothetical protein